MLIVGIDEAGLGPALGAFCVGAVAIRVDDEITPLAIWDAWAQLVSADKKNKLPLVTDSKIVYTARGIAGLELPLLALAKNLHFSLKNRDDFLTALGVSPTMFNEIAWYKNVAWNFPVAANNYEITALAKFFREINNVKTVSLQARIFTEKHFNLALAKGANKSAVTWQLVGDLIKHFVAFNEPMIIVIDRQGGRCFYAPLLADLFACPLIETIQETSAISEYRYQNALLRFATRAESSSLPTALASMLAKYLRERLMADLNAWFIDKIPTLKPTAGYHQDAPRFARAVAKILQENHIPRDDFWRTK